MNRIAGTGLAAGALVIAGGTPIALLSQGAASASPLGTTSTATLAEEHLSDASGTDEASDAEDQASEDSTADPSDDVDEVQGTDPEDTSGETVDATEALSGASMLGPAHAAAMKIWAHCVADVASGPKTVGQPMPPKTACGTKPLGPGQLMHQSATTTVPVPTTSDSTGSGDTASSDTKPQYDAPHADDSSTEHSGDSSRSEDHSDSTEDSGDQESGQTASSDHESGHDD